ncbi:unnamed protein product [Symbiodinium sp. CCMP2592]|nr:unnamed protein product [Symbiodinium sp. CCMP2592]
MSRDFALSSVSGVSSASVVSLLSHLLTTSSPIIDPCPLCPVLPELDWASFFLGLGFGARIDRLERVVEQLQGEVQVLREALGLDPEEFEVVAPSPLPTRQASYSGTPVATPTRARTASSWNVDPLQAPVAPAAPVRGESSVPSLPRSERDSACREIGLWIIRALAGDHRGASGRDRISQSSRFWIVFRDFSGGDCTPPRAYSTFAAAKAECKRGADCGQSVFIGLPARADVEAVCAAAGFPSAEADGEPLEVKDLAVLQPGGVDEEFVAGLLPLAVPADGSQTCEIVIVSEADGRFVVAVPSAVWSRKLAGRRLTKGGLTRASHLEIAAVSAEDRHVVMDGASVKVWVGLLEAALVPRLSFESGDNPDEAFGQDSHGVGLLPHGPSLVRAVQELPGLTSYASAESGVPEGDGGGALDSRVDRLEAAMSKVAAGMKVLLEQRGPGNGQPSAQATTTLGGGALGQRAKARAAPAGAGRADAFVHLDASVAQAALDAGVSRQSLAEMDRLVGGSGAKPPRNLGAVPLVADPLSESEGDREPEPPTTADGRKKPPLDQVGEALVRLTQVVETLAGQKKKTPATLDGLLDAAGPSASGGADSGPSLRRNAAARRALRAALQDNPSLLSATVENLMREDLHSMQTPGFEITPSARAWLEHRSRIGSHQTLARTSWAVAGALDAARRKAFEECEARLNVLMVCMDQVATDHGNWTLANELTLESPCPIHAFKAHEARDRDSDQVWSRILDGRWAEVALHHLRDQSDFLEKRARLNRRGGPSGAAEEQDHTKDDGKDKGKGHGAFAAYLRTTIRDGNVPPHTSQMWPCPPPYPEVFRCTAGVPLRWRRVQTCLIVILLSWLHLGGPSECPASCRLGGRLSRMQWRMVRTIEGLSWDSDFSDPIAAADMGRAASKVEDQHRLLGALSRAAAAFSMPGYTRFSSALFQGFKAAGAQHVTPLAPRFGKVVGALKRAEVIAAKTIEADRLTFPGPPRFNPSPFLDSPTRRRFENPSSFAAAPDTANRPPPRVRVLASRAQRLELFRKLAESGRLAPVRVAAERLPYAGGLFSVIKDLARDRLILDCRPANCLESPPSKWTSSLAGPECLLQLVIQPSECIRVSSADLRDYFYLFEATPDRLQRNLLRGSLTKAEARWVFGRDCSQLADRGRVRVAIATLGMGDCSACEYAQAAHIGVLRYYGLLSGEDLVLPGRPFPRSVLSVGVVIDDLVLLERCVRGSPSGRSDSLGVQKLNSVHAAYEAALLEANPKKGVRDAAAATFWGAKLCGDTGLLRPSPSRVWPLAFITARVATLGLVTRSLLESLVGSWTAVFLVRRRTLCLLDVAFEALRATRVGDVIRLSPALADELWSWVLVAPVCVANLRAQVCDVFFTTDASDHKIACASALVPSAVAEEAYRHTLVKGAWSRLLPPSQAWLRAKGFLEPSAELPDGKPYTPYPLWRALARSLTFRTAWVVPGALGQHINIKELRGLLELERRTARVMSSARLLVGLDSQVALGAALKGRSASAGLNSLLKRSLATMVGGDLYLGLAFLASGDNPSDDGTRDRAVRAPSEPLPSWFGRLARGDPGPLQEWLALQPEVRASKSTETFGPGTVDALPTVASDPKSSPCHVLLPRPPPSHLGLRSGRAQRARRNRARRAAELPKAAPRTLLPSLDCASSALALLQGLPRDFFVPARGPLDFTRKGALDLFSGTAGVARSLVRHGAPWVLCLDVVRGSAQDLDDPRLQRVIEALIRAAVFLSFGASPPCSSFSRAVHPPFRSLAFPRGLPHLGAAAFEKVTRGNRQADWTAHALALFRGRSSGHFWLEGPDGSFMWNLPSYSEFSAASAGSVCRLDQCRFGTAWRKRTRFCVNGALAGARLLCQCKGSHLVLRGRSAEHGRSWTSVAQAYPRLLAEFLGTCAAVHAGWSRAAPRVGGIPLSACLAGSPSGRLGEASHPGPRRPLRPRDSTLGLEDRPLQSANALELGRRGWERFLLWVEPSLSEPCLVVFARCPALLAMALRAYGNWLYKSGGSIHELRHTLLGAQRSFAGLKPWAPTAWELVSRWEAAEPTEHRIPIPEPVLKALVALAWLAGFKLFAGVTVLSFYGLGRIGEVLPTLRSDLLLPSDDWWSSTRAAFLCLRASKTMLRRRSRVQHIKIEDPKAVALLEAVFRDLPKGDRLYPLTPGAYRYRWNKLMEQLSVPKHARLTPGGLRGGGAVFSYRSGVPIQEIQWRMRLKNLQTLEFYLQEVGAVSALTSLHDTCARKIKAAGSLYTHFMVEYGMSAYGGYGSGSERFVKTLRFSAAGYGMSAYGGYGSGSERFVKTLRFSAAGAYGLRKITGTTYWPYGTGRDWFFVGDLDYMHGRRTPKVEVRERFEKLTPPLRKKRGHPQDMVFSQASIRSMRSTVGVPSVPGVFGGKSQQPRLSIQTLERWRSLNDATFGDMTGGGELERWRHQESAARAAASGQACSRSRKSLLAVVGSVQHRHLSDLTFSAKAEFLFREVPRTTGFDPAALLRSMRPTSPVLGPLSLQE